MSEYAVCTLCLTDTPLAEFLSCDHLCALCAYGPETFPLATTPMTAAEYEAIPWHDGPHAFIGCTDPSHTMDPAED